MGLYNRRMRRGQQKTQQPPREYAAIAAKLQQAVAHQQRGYLTQAESLCREILAQAPMNFNALHLLGVVQAQQGQYQAAVEFIQKALKENPKQASAYLNLGLALQKLNQSKEALASYERALSLKPDYAEALYNRGNALLDLKRSEDALASYDHALSLKPDYIEALNNRGNALLDLKRSEDALASYDHALSLKPDFAEALNNRGSALRDLKRHADALGSYDRALAFKSDFAEALNNRGNALQDLKRHADALGSFDRALALKPDYAEALNNRGNALQDLKRHADALTSYDRALSLKPDYIEALNNRGNALRDLKQPADALASYDRAFELKPDNVEVLHNRGKALLELKRYHDAAQSLARLLELTPNYSFAKGLLLHTKMSCCDWTQFIPMADSINKDVQAKKKSAEPFGYQGISNSPEDLQLCAELFAAERFPRSPTTLWTGEKYRNPKIHIGYLSGEFRKQATAFLITELFELHDRSRFELSAFDNGWNDASEIRGRIDKAFDEVIDITRLGDLEAATIIQQKQIDVLVNLNGYFGRGRQGIFSHKPCPIQVNYLGYPGTMGADYIDYILADLHVIPPEQEAFYTEKVVYLPDTYQVNDSKRRIAERTPTRAEVGLPDTGFVFCCFNNNYKILPDIFDIWMRLLSKVTGSVLWLLEDNPAASHNLRREAEQRAVAPQRLVFAPRMKLDEHLARHRLADLFLDTLPCNAHTTASDALWAGLPVLTCMGSAFAGRVAGSLLNAVGLPQLITRSVEDYEALALKLATTPTMLSEIRAKLAQNRTTYPLFDTERFRRHIESAYITMWERYQRGEPPASFAVHPIQ